MFVPFKAIMAIQPAGHADAPGLIAFGQQYAQQGFDRLQPTRNKVTTY
jgi:hypothetical protein